MLGSVGIWTLHRGSRCRHFVWPYWMTWAGRCWRGQRSLNWFCECQWTGSLGSQARQASSSTTQSLTVSDSLGHHCNPLYLPWRFGIGSLFTAVPKVQFRDAVYVGNENSGQISAIVYRSGDISYKSTVRCYSRQGTAQVMMDFHERPNTDASVITFLPGSVTNHSIALLLSPLKTRYKYFKQCLSTFFQERLKSLARLYLWTTPNMKKKKNCASFWEALRVNLHLGHQ